MIVGLQQTPATLVHKLRANAMAPCQVMVISCCDLPALPTLLQQFPLQQMLHLRTLAAFIPPYDPEHAYDAVAATFEYALNKKGISDIILLGHHGCQALQFGASDVQGVGALEEWRTLLEKEAENLLCTQPLLTRHEQYRFMEKLALLVSFNHLVSYPVINDCLLDQQLALHVWHFDPMLGRVEVFNQQTTEFEPLEIING